MEEVITFLANYNDLKNTTVIVALSGGPDSMCLLNILYSIRNELNIRIICAHVNHNLRKESKKEYEFLRKYCQNINIDLEYFEINNYYNNNVEAFGRKKRYEFFENLVIKYNAKFLFTAHHADDLIETILMRISRGSSLEGYAGFKKIAKREDYYIVRPLISVTKNDIIQYNNKHNIKYVIDQSNFSDIHTRNRYRKKILPLLKEENKNIHKKYEEFSNELIKYNDYVEKQANMIIDNIIVKNKININSLKTLDILIQEKIIQKYLKKIYNDKFYLIEKKHISNIIEISNSNKSNVYVFLPNNIKLIKSYDKIYFLDNCNDYKNDYKIELNSEIQLNSMTFNCINDKDDSSNYCIKLSSKEIELPLYLRNYNSGDKIQVKGLNGSKKIKDIFINSKIPLPERNRYPILVDKTDKILWIPGVKKSKYDKHKEDFCDIIIKCILKEEKKNEQKN